MKMKKCPIALYVRSSIQGAAGAQEDALRAHALGLACDVVGVYRGDGTRLPLAQLVADAVEGKFDRVLITDTTRLGRSPRDVKRIIGALDSLGVPVATAEGSSGPDLISVFQQVTLQAALANHGARTARGKAAAKGRREGK